MLPILIAEWDAEHQHDHHPINTVAQMFDVLGEFFSIGGAIRVPYLYRSICGNLVSCEQAYDITTQILKIETRLIDQEKILPVGYRLDARCLHPHLKASS